MRLDRFRIKEREGNRVGMLVLIQFLHRYVENTTSLRPCTYDHGYLNETAIPCTFPLGTKTFEGTIFNITDEDMLPSDLSYHRPDRQPLAAMYLHHSEQCVSPPSAFRLPRTVHPPSELAVSITCSATASVSPFSHHSHPPCLHTRFHLHIHILTSTTFTISLSFVLLIQRRVGRLLVRGNPALTVYSACVPYNW